MPAPANFTARYTGVAIALHWLVALLIVAALGVGSFMADLPLSPTRLRLVNWHKWTGVTILALTLLRLLWRLTHRPPPDVAMPRWQTGLAHAGHALLYLLCLAVPLVGWAYSSAAGFAVVWLGVLPLPDLLPADKAMAQAVKPWHAALAWTLAVVVTGHVAAALWHQVVNRDGVIDRMRWRR
jgi:cytochrome b561